MHRRSIRTLVVAVASAALAGPGAAADSVARPASAASSPHAMGMRPSARKGPPPGPTWLVDINSVSRKELKTLPGIGDAEADRIIANRPYLSKTELVTKEVLPAAQYLSLKSRIVAMPKAKAKATPTLTPTPTPTLKAPPA